MSETEIWKQVKGWELYEVSNFGRVRRVINPYPAGPVGTSGHRRRAVALWDGHGKRRAKLLHHIVAEAFIGPRGNKHVNHIDGNPGNNSADNLEYVTQRENSEHFVRMNPVPYAQTRSKVPQEIKWRIIELRRQGWGMKRIGKEVGVTYQAVQRVLWIAAYESLYTHHEAEAAHLQPTVGNGKSSQESA